MEKKFRVIAGGFCFFLALAFAALIAFASNANVQEIKTLVCDHIEPVCKQVSIKETAVLMSLLCLLIGNYLLPEWPETVDKEENAKKEKPHLRVVR